MKINNKIKEIEKEIEEVELLKRKSKTEIEFNIKKEYLLKQRTKLKLLKRFQKEIKELQEDVDKVVTKGCLGTSANCYLIKKEINNTIKKRFGEIKNA